MSRPILSCLVSCLALPCHYLAKPTNHAFITYRVGGLVGFSTMAFSRRTVNLGSLSLGFVVFRFVFVLFHSTFCVARTILCFTLNSLSGLGLGLGLRLGLGYNLLCLSMTVLSHVVALLSPKPNRDPDRNPPPFVWHHIPSVQALAVVQDTL